MKKILAIKTEHPHITKIKGICGGRPIIVGTRTPVSSIVGYYKMGLSVDEILNGLPHLKPSQVYDALAYYYDHKEEIDKEMENNSEEKLIKIYPQGKYK